MLVQVVLVCSRQFGEFLLERVISPQLEAGPDTQTKVLSLLQSWAHAFSHDAELQGNCILIEFLNFDVDTFGLYYCSYNFHICQ